ncbi:hypothetical protein [Pigmentiphaga humi]|uniref:hypothetical protein n=1 Tax=Pigmentiphaga humi TaxID=2478468 RepID=UPI000F52E293|nr:hypothetical protein [Pigmentiphaga humi]
MAISANTAPSVVLVHGKQALQYLHVVFTYARILQMAILITRGGAIFDFTWRHGRFNVCAMRGTQSA